MTRLSILKTTLTGALWLALGTSAFAAEPPAHVRGTIVSATPSNVTVKTAAGDVSLAIDAKTKMAGIVSSSLDQIKEGTFVGIANVPGAKSSRALEVVVFPEAMRGAGLGDYPWDLAPKKEGATATSSMTNGTVKASMAASAPESSSAMTNGTVKKTESAKGLVLTVDYGKGEETIRVPKNVPVVGVVPGDASKLLPGAHVFVSTRPDAPTSAAFVAVGIDGTVPPM